MILLILGLIIFFVGQALHRGDVNLKRFSSPVRIVGFILIDVLEPGVFTGEFLRSLGVVKNLGIAQQRLGFGVAALQVFDVRTEVHEI